MARDLGRSPSTIADEVARNRTVAKGPGRPRGRLPETAVVAALLQRVQAPALPLLQEIFAQRNATGVHLTTCKFWHLKTYIELRFGPKNAASPQSRAN